MEQQILEEKSQEDILLQDNALALKIAIDSSTSCHNFTHKDMLNPSSDYAYANNPGMHICSSELFKNAIINPASVISCNFVLNQSSCPFYSPDYSVLLKSSFTLFNQTITYYLSRFRAFDGTYFYKIYDSNAVIYFTLNYTNISNVNGNIDEEAMKVFHKFLEDSFDNQNYSVDHVSSKNHDKQEQKNNKSYLKSLIS